MTPPYMVGSSPRGFACWKWWNRFAQAATSLPLQLPVLYSRTTLSFPVDLLPTFLKPTTCLQTTCNPSFIKSFFTMLIHSDAQNLPTALLPPSSVRGECGATVTTGVVSSGGTGGEKSSVDHQQTFLNKLTVCLARVIISL